MKVQNSGRTDRKSRLLSAGRFFRLSGVVARIRNFISRRFDESIFMNTAGHLRQIFFRLRLRVLGTFLLTFGAYASIVAILVDLFNERQIVGADLFGGVALIVLSIPLLMSGGNISAALLASHLGNTLCDYLGIRRESLQELSLVGHVNIAFILGVVAGTLTLWTSPVLIVSWFLAAVGIGIIFVLPENGIMFAAVLLLFAGQKTQLWILSVTVASYLLKLIRGKRSLSFYKRDVFAVLVLLAVLGGGLLNRSGVIFPQTGMYVLFMCSYFLSTLTVYDFRKVNRIVTALCAGGGVLAAMYLAGVALDTFLSESFVRDAGFLLHFVQDLPVFQEDLAAILFMVLIPLSVGGCLRTSPCMSRHTAAFCAVVMTAALVLCSRGVEVLCAFIAVILLLLLYRKRTGYFFLGIILAVLVLTVHLTGSFGDQIYAYFAAQVAALGHGVREFLSQIMLLDFSQMIAGYGFASSLQEPFQIQGGAGSSYLSFVRILGLIGLLAFAVFVIVFIGTSLQFYRRTLEKGRVPDALLRFGVVRSTADMRLGGGAPLCSIAALLLCGVAMPVWQNGAAFELFWLLCGLGAAYIKSATREIDKADQAGLSNFGSENAAITLKRKKED